MPTPPLILMRHGETLFNEEGRYQGQSDSALTARGIGQAVAVADLLAARLAHTSVRIVTSPLGRARKTAEIVADRLGAAGIDMDDRLTEVGMGAWDGLTRAEIAVGWPEARRGRAHREWVFHGPGGETIGDVTARLSAALADFRARSEGPSILVSHAMAGRVIRALHSGQPVLDALRLDAPQDAAFALLDGGAIEVMATEDYRRRHAGLTGSPTASSPEGPQR